MSLLDRLGQKLNQLFDELDIPDTIREELQRGKAALEQSHPAAAEELLTRAVTVAPEHATAWHLLA